MITQLFAEVMNFKVKRSTVQEGRKEIAAGWPCLAASQGLHHTGCKWVTQNKLEQK